MEGHVIRYGDLLFEPEDGEEDPGDVLKGTARKAVKQVKLLKSLLSLRDAFQWTHQEV